MTAKLQCHQLIQGDPVTSPLLVICFGFLLLLFVLVFVSLG
jgi:hypothetical protein